MEKAAKAEAGESPAARQIERENLLASIRIYLQSSAKLVDDWQEIQSAVEEGFDFPRLRERLTASQVEPASPTFKDEPMPESTTASKADDANLPVKSAALRELLDSVVDDPEAWLSMPSEQFGGRRPFDLIGTEEEHKIVDLLLAVDQGLF